MKVLISTLLISALLATSAQAERGMGKKGVDIEKVISTLQLEETQAASLKNLIETQRAERQAMRQQATKDREQKRALKKQHRQAILDVLGYEKMYEYEEIVRQSGSKKRRTKKQR